ncbi:DUF4290 domain-containing protein [Capnocytophaga sp. ARDL2]|uniref:DUF4290 domain-containing protein n=1 Tax=Capnocytophaga sp. ARDL2 TaxID=3238809 RepID=UPI003558D55D
MNKKEIVSKLEYNSQRPPLILPEYGRMFQKMVQKIAQTPDREERNKAAKYAIVIMGDLNPHLRNIPEYQHKLWDQLFAMADFDIDIDSPFDIPSRESVKVEPVMLDYPQQKPKYRYYGNNIKAMIDEAVKWEDSEKKEGLIWTIANHMKKCYLNWNKDTVDDETIFNHLYELSNGKINLLDENETLSSVQKLIHVTKRQSNKATFTPQNRNQNSTSSSNQSNYQANQRNHQTYRNKKNNNNQNNTNRNFHTNKNKQS